MTQAFLFITEKFFAENLLKMAPNLSNLTQVSTFINLMKLWDFSPYVAIKTSSISSTSAVDPSVSPSGGCSSIENDCRTYIEPLKIEQHTKIISRL